MREQWLEAAAELGLPVTDDFNGAHPEGSGAIRSRFATAGAGRRPDAFLRPALRRSNVKLETRAWVSRLRCEGRRVIGVEYVRDNEPRYARADREVIVCAGSVNTPQLLQLSGIGPAAEPGRSRDRAHPRQSRGRREPAGSSGRRVLVQGDRGRR